MPRLPDPCLSAWTAADLLGLTYLVPVPWVWHAWSVTLPEPGLGQYPAALTDPLVLSVFLRTLRICVIVTVFR
jgi:putative spermidine/putrescine transport system permease protein